MEKREIDTLYLHETLRHEVKDAFEELVQGLEREWSRKKELHSIIIATVITGLAVNIVSSGIINYIERGSINPINVVIALIFLTTSTAIWYYIIRHYSIKYSPQATYICILSRLRDKGVMKILEGLRKKSLVIKGEEIVEYAYKMLKTFHSNAVDEIRLEISSNEITSRGMKYIKVRYYAGLAELNVEVCPLPVLAFKNNELSIVYTHDIEIIFTLRLSEKKLRGEASYDVLKGIMYKTQLLVYNTIEIILNYLSMRLDQVQNKHK